MKKVIITGLVLISTVAMSQAPAIAAASKPGTAVQATAKEKLLIGKVGFTDESYCAGNGGQTSPQYYACGDSYRQKKFVTTWAFSVKNLSPTRSAAQVRVQLTFLNASGTVLQQNIVSVSREIKPGKLAWAASNENATDASITGVASVQAKLVGNSWMVPTKTIYQTPINLNVTPLYKEPSQCQLTFPCSFVNGNPLTGALTKIQTDGVFTLRGPAGYFNKLVIFLNTAGEPIGGWSYSDLVNYTTGSQQVGPRLYMTDYEMGNVATYLYVVQK